MTIVWISAAVVIIVVAGAWLARTPVLQGKLLPELRWLFASVAPPEDYFARLGVFAISLAEPGAVRALAFRHKYVGAYIIGLLASKPVPQGVPSYRARFGLSFRCLVGGRSVFEKQIGAVTGPWWSRSEAGFTLLEYDVPRDLPVDQDIECVIRVDASDPDFERQYGPISVFVRKHTEK